jgi:hypothetical protein
MYAHAIKVLDQHTETSSFWYLHRCKKKCAENELKIANLYIAEIQDLASKMKIVSKRGRSSTLRNAMKIGPPVVLEEGRQRDASGVGI